MTVTPPDQLLSDYAAADPALAEALLAQLLTIHASPLIEAILRRRLGSLSASHAEDLRQEVLTSLLPRLRDIRLGRAAAFDRFHSYVASMAHHACDRHFRALHPDRQRLKNRLHYLLEHLPGFGLWAHTDGATLCGRLFWQGRPPAIQSATQLPPLTLSAADLPAAVDLVFAHSPGPLPLDVLLDYLATSFGLRKPDSSLDDDVNAIPSAAPLPDRLAVLRQQLESLWREVVDLPRNQRAALLLNLRDETGHSPLEFLPQLGIATLRQLADLLEIPLPAFLPLWRQIPLEDLVIATLLGINRQQVINLRQAARQRLARRTKENLP